MATYKTPGVYVEEVSTFPPSVAEVSTAIPAFLGYTEKGTANEPTRVNTLLEYEELFGGPQATDFTADVATDGSISIEKTNIGTKNQLMYYCLKMYFNNGGGPCYIVSIGEYKTAPDKADFASGLEALAKEDEPTLIVLTDAVNLTTEADYYEVSNQALAQCGKLRDRFAILDVLDRKVPEFRDGIGTNDLKYGAAYYPYLRTTLNNAYEESRVTVNWPPTHEIANGIKVTYVGENATANLVIAAGPATADNIAFAVAEAENEATLTITLKGDKAKAADLIAAWQVSDDATGFNIVQAGNGAVDISPSTTVSLVKATNTLASIKDEFTQTYQQVRAELAEQRITLPPSAAIAGVYAQVDRNRGVWKAPANVSLSSVFGPTIKITNDVQDGLTVHADGGKSINAIRSFTGKGTLVWGARTLAGNDNEWRYVNVRRLFNMIEESTQKATAFAVFEPNDATTWLKVKGMIESYLYGLWEQGALAGPTPDSAYFVNVGLGRTMTTQDVLEGRMIVEMGIAAVRPAEFIVLRFSHKLQEA